MDYNNQFDYWNNTWNSIPDEESYTEIECKEASLTKWNCTFGLIFGSGFLFFPLFFGYLILSYPQNVRGEESVGGRTFAFVLLSIFFVIGVCSLYYSFRNIYYYLLVKSKGELLQGYVIGYEDDNTYYNGLPGQICKIVIDLPEGKRLIKYCLGSVNQPYLINEPVELKRYNDIFYLKMKKSYLR